jgi:lipopolysaccharide/colanic/teichoic acid biosynthesis glycosyltransferase
MPNSANIFELPLPASQTAGQVKSHKTTGIKRGLDILVSGGLILVLAPLAGIVALLIKLTDGGPVFFWQNRVGYLGRVFAFPKFRSMVVDAEALQEKMQALNSHGDSVTFKMRRDPRVTWIGRLTRRFSIDELPQLWCVFKGDMSLVGPRPPLEREVVAYSADDWRRLEAVPGLTCTWQINGRGDIPFPQQVALDIEYIDSRSHYCDLVILLKTVPAVLLGRGAY